METDVVHIRPARPKDASALAEVYAEAWRGAYRGIIPHLSLERMVARRGERWWKAALAERRPLLVLAFGCTAALAEDDDDKVPEADMAKVTAALADLGCKDPEGVKKEEEGIYEIDDAKCKMGTMDIKLDKDFSVILISRY